MKASAEPMVSVIIPFFNEEQFIGEAIESVLQQKYDSWELLLVDDGSSNQSTTIAKEYAIKYAEKIFYIEHENHANRGVCISRNLGVKKSNGSLIALLDADDKWLPEYLSHQVSIFSKYPDVGMAAEGSLQWYNWDEPRIENFEILVGVAPNKLYHPPQLMLQLYPLSSGAAPGPCALMLKKSAIIEVGGFEEAFTKEYQLYEDQAFLCKIYLQKKVYISSTCNNLYRQRPESVVNWVKAKGQYHTVRKYFLNWLEVYLHQNKIKDKRLKQLLKKALLPYNYPLIYFWTCTAPQKLKKLIKRIIPNTIKRFLKSKFLARNNACLH